MKKKLCITGLLLALNVPAWAGIYNYGTRNGGSTIGNIPDNSSVGFSDSQTVSGLGSSISDLILTFVLQGGVESDLSGYLRLGDQTASPSYNLTTLIQSQTLNQNTPTTYTIDFTTAGFQSVFNNQNPNGNWTLFFADQSPGGQTALNGWSLSITPVPEPVNVTLGIFGGMVGLIGLVRSGVWKKMLPAKRD